MKTAKRQTEQPHFLTVPEVAELLRVKPRTIYGWVAIGRIPHLKPSRNVLLFDRDRVLEWVEGTRQGGRDGGGENSSNVVALNALR